jgi:hypothetical protein
VGYRQITPDEEAWCEFVGQEERKTIDVCRDAGKVILQMMGIVVPGYLAVLVAIFKDRPFDVPRLFLWPLSFWFASMILALVALLPWSWKAPKNFPVRIKEAFLQMVQRKRMVVLASGGLAISGMFILVLAFF